MNDTNIFCPHCKKLISLNATVCPFCNKEVTVLQDYINRQLNSVSPSVENSALQNQLSQGSVSSPDVNNVPNVVSSKSNFVNVITALLFIAAVAFGIYYFINKKGNEVDLFALSGVYHNDKYYVKVAMKGQDVLGISLFENIDDELSSEFFGPNDYDGNLYFDYFGTTELFMNDEGVFTGSAKIRFSDDLMFVEMTNDENGLNIKVTSNNTVNSITNFTGSYKMLETELMGWTGKYERDGVIVYIDEVYYGYLDIYITDGMEESLYVEGVTGDDDFENCEYTANEINCSMEFFEMNESIKITKSSDGIIIDGNSNVGKSGEFINSLDGTYKRVK